jgi:copper homeostasis protein
MRQIICEVCVDSLDGALTAQQAGAHRIELCGSLNEGGITPSAALVQKVKQQIDLPVHVMIRPRGGDFNYSPAEFETMLGDVVFAREQQVDGVVIGCLTLDGAVDVHQTRELIEAARPLSVTFHRAFDMTRDLFEAMDVLVDLGVDRLLTSGGQSSVDAGLETLIQLVNRSAGRIAVMPGGGINENNIKQIVARSGVKEIHFSARTTMQSQMRFRNLNCAMGDGSDYIRRVTDGNRIRAMMRVLSEGS